jgi:hypothetical protein
MVIDLLELRSGDSSGGGFPSSLINWAAYLKGVNVVTKVNDAGLKRQKKNCENVVVSKILSLSRSCHSRPLR